MAFQGFKQHLAYLDSLNNLNNLTFKQFKYSFFNLILFQFFILNFLK